MARPRGNYAATAARRDAIIRAALEIFGEFGFNGSSLKQVAEAVDISEAGILHHFGTKANLLTEVLRSRDDLSEVFLPSDGSNGIAFVAGWLDLVEYNSNHPGHVELFTTLAAEAIAWFNQTFGESYTAEELLAQVNLDEEALKQIATDAAKGIFGFAVSLIGGVFGLFTFALIAFYLSADGPRLRRYIASMMPAQSQTVFLNVWDITADKTGRYVAARAILAAVNSFFSGIVFAVIGLPYWLPLALWTGIVAQFVPTIGTYISIILPVIVGLLSGNPWLGVIVLVYALIYQQIENLTIEPRISAKAVDVHPAYGFVAVLLGASLFGVAGALLAVPVGAMVLALVQIYVKRHDLVEDTAGADPPAGEPA